MQAGDPPARPGSRAPSTGAVVLVIAAQLRLVVVVLPELGGTPHSGTLRIVVVVLAAVAFGLVVAGLTLLRLVRHLATTRAERARRAVAEERSRLSRDVHDLLGMSLSVITLKCELTARLLPGDADLSRAQLAEVIVLARRALADVRTIARGATSLDLAAEIELAKNTLTDVDVRVRFHQDGPVPDGRVGAALAAVLREGVTNVLRHSDATWCAVTLRRTDGDVLLALVNDGVRPRAEPDDGGGHGLQNLTGRAVALGGELQVRCDGAVHRLAVRLPLPPA